MMHLPTCFVVIICLNQAFVLVLLLNYISSCQSWQGVLVQMVVVESKFVDLWVIVFMGGDLFCFMPIWYV